MSRVYTVNMIPGGVPRTVNVSQYDNDYNVEVTLLEGQGAYSIPAGATIRVEGTKPDGLGFEYDCTYASNVVQMPIKTQMSVIAGNFPIELVVYKSGVRVGSANMVLAVEKAPLGEGTDISDTVIPDIIDAAETNAERAEDAADRAEAAADTAEAAAEEVEETAIDLAPVIVSNASGSIASFPDGTNRDATRVVVNIIPSQSGSGDPSPTNVRTISGYTSVDVVSKGLNLWDEVWETGNIDGTTGQNTTSSTRIRTKNYIPVVAGSPIYFCNGSGETYALRWYKSDKSFISSEAGNTASKVWTPPSTAAFLRFVLVETTYGNDVSVNYPSTETIYNAYTSTTTTIPLPPSAGTVYGGTLDVTNGTLTVDMAYVSTTWGSMVTPSVLGTYERRNINLNNLGFYPMYPPTKIPVSNVAPYNVSYASDSLHFYVNDNQLLMFLPTSTASSTQITCAFQLTTPTTYTLTPTQIKTLQGYNNIYSPQGSVSVDYRADTKLYIEKLTKPTEDDMVANANIASGKFFMVGNNLYISTTAITTGTTIVPGSNCTALSLADALNQINA